tara:strand:+ start:50 stop:1075 length:1026 start_codon:yes stop_codon:yes gene_type:complete
MAENDIPIVVDETLSATADQNNDRANNAAREDLKAQVDYAMANGDFGERTGGKTSTTSASKIGLTVASARGLLEEQNKAVNYTGKIKRKDIDDFIKQFNKEQSKQLEKIVKIANQSIKPDTTDASKRNVVESIITTQFPSFFNTAQYASDYLWEKVNFKDSDSLSGQNLATLSTTKDIVAQFNLLRWSPKETEIAAAKIAKGEMSEKAFRAELQRLAIKEYPQLADRFARDPELTTLDILGTARDIIARVWEVDKETVGFDNPLLSKWINGTTVLDFPESTDTLSKGKVMEAKQNAKTEYMSRYDLILAAKRAPEYQFTEAANEDARASANAFGSAFGFGV